MDKYSPVHKSTSTQGYKKQQLKKHSVLIKNTIKDSILLSPDKKHKLVQNSGMKSKPLNDRISLKRFHSTETKKPLINKGNKDTNYKELKAFFCYLFNSISKLNDDIMYSKEHWRRTNEIHNSETIKSGIEINNEMSKTIKDLQAKAFNTVNLVFEQESLKSEYNSFDDYEELLRRVEKYEEELLRLKPCKELIERKKELEDKVKTLQNIIERQHEENVENKVKLKKYIEGYNVVKEMLLKKNKDFVNVFGGKISYLEVAIKSVESKVNELIDKKYGSVIICELKSKLMQRNNEIKHIIHRVLDYKESVSNKLKNIIEKEKVNMNRIEILIEHLKSIRSNNKLLQKEYMKLNELIKTQEEQYLIQAMNTKELKAIIEENEKEVKTKRAIQDNYIKAEEIIKILLITNEQLKADSYHAITQIGNGFNAFYHKLYNKITLKINEYNKRIEEVIKSTMKEIPIKLMKVVDGKEIERLGTELETICKQMKE